MFEWDWLTEWVYELTIMSKMKEASFSWNDCLKLKRSVIQSHMSREWRYFLKCEKPEMNQWSMTKHPYDANHCRNGIKRSGKQRHRNFEWNSDVALLCLAYILWWEVAVVKVHSALRHLRRSCFFKFLSKIPGQYGALSVNWGSTLVWKKGALNKSVKLVIPQIALYPTDDELSPA